MHYYSKIYLLNIKTTENTIIIKMIKIIIIKATTCVFDDNDDNFIALCYTQD